MQRPLAVAALAALALSRADPPLPEVLSDPAPSAHGAGPVPSGAISGATLQTHADDIVDYTLRAKLDPDAHTIAAAGTIHFRNASTEPVSELWLHLYLNAFKNDRSDFLRERVGGRGSQPPESWGSVEVRKLAIREADGTSTDLLPRMELHRPGEEDETDARVPLPRELSPGASIDLDVTFDDKLPVIVERTGYRGHFHMVGQWFPKIARLEPDGTWAHFPFHHLSEFYADFGTYDVTLDVPVDYTIGATGPVVETRIDAGRRIERHVQADVHDFAWTAWDRWQSKHEAIDGVEVTVLYPPGFDDVAARDLEALRFALPYESGRYGRYPYQVLTLVHPQSDASEAGGMEYPTLITSDGPWLTPKSILVPEIVTVHELGHQWFYGLVATNEANWPFLDEGLNQFAETVAMARWRGAGSAANLWGLQVGDDSIQAVASNRAVQDEPVAQPAAAFSTGASYSRLVYSRTAAVLDTLARVYGEDAVVGALGEYARRFRFQHPGPEQLFGVFAETMGPEIAATLRAALFEKGWVDYTVDDVREASVLVRRRGTLSFPVDVELVFEDGTRRRERWDGAGESKRIATSDAGRLVAAVVDPDHRVTIDANLENNAGAAPERGHGAPRTMERATYWMQLAVQAVSP